MGKKTISLNLDDIGTEGDTLISSILNPKQGKDLKVNNKQGDINNKKVKIPKEKNTITIDLGEDSKAELKLSDIKIEKPTKGKLKGKKKKRVEPFINEGGINKMSKVAKLDDFFTISKDENANSLTHPKTKDYQVGKEGAEIKLQNIQAQLKKVKNKISRKGRNNVDVKYLDSLNKLLKKEEKYISILNSFSKIKNHSLATPDVNNNSNYTQNHIQNNKKNTHYTIKKIDNSLVNKNKINKPKTNNIVSEIDGEIDRINILLDLTEGKKGKYQGIKTELTENYDNRGNISDTNNISKNGYISDTDTGSNKGEFKNVNLQMNLDGIDYLPNMDINQLKKNNIKGNKYGEGNKSNLKKEVSPPKSMFSVKANLLALKEREKMLAKQKRKIQEKLEFKKKQILKAKQQEKEIRKIKALEEEKRRLFELDREVKRLDKLRYQQSLEMKNTMKQIAQKGISTQQNIDNIQKEEFKNKQIQKQNNNKNIILGKNGYPIYQPFTYNIKTSNGILNNNSQDKNKGNSKTLLTKLHNNMLNVGVGEQVLFKSIPIKEDNYVIDNSFVNKKNIKSLTVSNKGYKYIRKDLIDNENSWQEWKINHLQYFKNIENTNTVVFLYPYNTYISYLNNSIICKNNNFSDKYDLETKDNNKNICSTNKLLSAYKRDIYKKIPLEDRKTELCQYLGMKKKENLENILEQGLRKIVPIKKESSKLILLKIWYGCFEEGKLLISNGNNKLFSQKTENIEMVSFT